MTELQQHKQKLEDQICKMANNKSRITVGDVSIYDTEQEKKSV